MRLYDLFKYREVYKYMIIIINDSQESDRDANR